MQDRLVAVAAHQTQRTAGFAAPRAALGREDLALEIGDRLLVEPAVDGDVVALLNEIAGVGDAVGELAVVGQDQEAGAVEVEPADAVQPRLRRVLDEVDRARAPLGIAVGADGSARLEEHDVDMLLRPAQRTPVDLDLVDGRVDPGRQPVDDLAVDGHGARKHEFLALAAGGDTRVGHHPLQAQAARLVGELALGHCGLAGLPGGTHLDSVRGARNARACRLSSRHATL